MQITVNEQIGKLRTFGLVSGLMLALAGVACACALVLAVVTAANSLNDETNSGVFAGCLSALTNDIQLTFNSSCDDGNPCTRDFAVGDTDTCRSMTAIDGTTCNDACYFADTTTCQIDNSTGLSKCVGTCPSNRVDCTPWLPTLGALFQSFVAEPAETGLYFYTNVDFGAYCEAFVIDIGYPASAHGTLTQVGYYLPFYLGWPNAGQPDICMQLLNTSDPHYGCVTSQYYFVAPVPNVTYTLTDEILHGFPTPPNNVFICRYSYTCGLTEFIPVP